MIKLINIPTLYFGKIEHALASNASGRDASCEWVVLPLQCMERIPKIECEAAATLQGTEKKTWKFAFTASVHFDKVISNV